MRKSWLAAATGATALSLLAAPALAGANYSRATGGGQTLVSTDATGAGNTIAFSAQNTADGAKGEVQYIDRSGGTGQAQVQSHGVVDCLSVSKNTAVIGGHWTSGERTGPFEIKVVDNGQGAAADNDVITIDDATPTGSGCSWDDSNHKASAELARGNAQVYDASSNS